MTFSWFLFIYVKEKRGKTKSDGERSVWLTYIQNQKVNQRRNARSCNLAFFFWGGVFINTSACGIRTKKKKKIRLKVRLRTCSKKKSLSVCQQS